jgi:hypothetical protein
MMSATQSALTAVRFHVLVAVVIILALGLVLNAQFGEGDES